VAKRASSVAIALAAVGCLGAGHQYMVRAQAVNVVSLDAPPPTTVWSGVYTINDAQRGKVAYAKRCARCHAADLKGVAGVAPIVGKPFFDRWHDLRVFDTVAFIQSATRHDFRTFVPASEARDMVAFLLQQNGVPPGNEPFPKDYGVLNEILITVPPDN
jgi:S-disulfanyl-L-cysteine oxidoreductase SoxD